MLPIKDCVCFTWVVVGCAKLSSFICMFTSMIAACDRVFALCSVWFGSVARGLCVCVVYFTYRTNLHPTDCVYVQVCDCTVSLSRFVCQCTVCPLYVCCRGDGWGERDLLSRATLTHMASEACAPFNCTAFSQVTMDVVGARQSGDA